MRQLPLELGHRPSLAGDDFLVADSNRAAVAWLDSWPSWPAVGLAIYGPSGCGKTHIAHVWRGRSGAPLIDPAGLAGADLPVLVAAAGAVAIDDIDPQLQPIAERPLLHLHNLLAERRGHLLICSRTPPARWHVVLPDLASRLAAMPAVAVEPPEDALLEAVMAKLFADRQLAVGAEVIQYLGRRIERSFAAAREVVAALDRASLAARRRVTPALAREVLAGMGLSDEQPPGTD